MALLLIAVALLGGCSRIQVAYNSAEPLLKLYANDYLELEPDQIERWTPRLKASLATHRAQELPYLAAFFDATLKASRSGFNERNTACLLTNFKDLYQRQGRLVVRLAAPLLADLTPQQIKALDTRFKLEYEDDKIDPETRDFAAERRKRADRYVDSIEDWTGRLSGSQRNLVAEVTARMPDTRVAMLEYRTRKRAKLITLLRNGAEEPQLVTFLQAWLVDFADLPPAMDRAGDELGTRIGELLIRLVPSLDERQRRELDKRLQRMRDDLMDLQKDPRMPPLQC